MTGYQAGLPQTSRRTRLLAAALGASVAVCGVGAVTGGVTEARADTPVVTGYPATPTEARHPSRTSDLLVQIPYLAQLDNDVSGYTVTAVAVDGRGAPVAGVPRRELLTDQRGTVTFEALTPGVWRVTASAPTGAGDDADTRYPVFQTMHAAVPMISPEGDWWYDPHIVLKPTAETEPVPTTTVTVTPEPSVSPTPEPTVPTPSEPTPGLSSESTPWWLLLIPGLALLPGVDTGSSSDAGAHAPADIDVPVPAGADAAQVTGTPGTGASSPDAPADGQVATQSVNGQGTTGQPEQPARVREGLPVTGVNITVLLAAAALLAMAGAGLLVSRRGVGARAAGAVESGETDSAGFRDN